MSSAVVSLCFKVTQKPRHWGDYAPNDGVLFVELDGLIQGSNTEGTPCEASRGVRERVGKFLEDLSGFSFVHGNGISRISALAQGNIQRNLGEERNIVAKLGAQAI